MVSRTPYKKVPEAGKGVLPPALLTFSLKVLFSWGIIGLRKTQGRSMFIKRKA